MNIPNIDKVIHLGAYFVMGILAWRAFIPRYPNPVLLTLLFCSIYGISDEWHQSFINGRSPEIADWVADTVGGALAVIFMKNFLADYRLIPRN